MTLFRWGCCHCFLQKKWILNFLWRKWNTYIIRCLINFRRRLGGHSKTRHSDISSAHFQYVDLLFYLRLFVRRRPLLRRVLLPRSGDDDAGFVADFQLDSPRQFDHRPLCGRAERGASRFGELDRWRGREQWRRLDGRVVRMMIQLLLAGTAENNSPMKSWRRISVLRNKHNLRISRRISCKTLKMSEIFREM